jgi:hypothetical protein
LSCTPPAEALAHAQFHARGSAAGIGAAVVSSEIAGGEHAWECIVTDGDEWHYIRVLGTGVGPFPNISAEDVEQGIERFASTLPAPGRLRRLLNANPLHIDRNAVVTD